MEESREINATVSRVFFPKQFTESFEYAAFQVLLPDNTALTVSGQTFPLRSGDEIKIEGSIVNDQKYGKQFQIDTVKRNLDTEKGRYQFAKKIFGDKTTDIIWDYFGGSVEEIFARLKEDPHSFQRISGIGAKRVEKFVSKYDDLMCVEEVFVTLKDYGFNINDSHKVYKVFGEDALDVIKKNPYKLMWNIRGMSFQKADRIARKFDYRFEDPKRLVAGVFSAFKNYSMFGHTYIPKHILAREVKRMLTYVDEVSNYTPTDILVENFIDVMVERSVVIEKNERFYLKPTYEEELYIERFLQENAYRFNTFANVDEQIRDYEKIKGFNLAEQQKAALQNSLKYRFSIITGGPGTGKTTILDFLLKIARTKYRDYEIALCSPTGKAARRMSEVVGLPASTIHSLLEVEPENQTLENFKYNENNQLPKRLIVVDEVSMIDQSLTTSLLKATEDGAQVVFVGDIDQLESVGAGNVLHDMIKANVPTVKLDKVYRQKGDSKILDLSVDIKREREKDLSDTNDFKFLETTESETVSKLYLEEVKRWGIDQVCLLTPTNKNELGTKKLNQIIQEEFNPSKEGQLEVKSYPYVYRVGDKIMQTKNDNKLGVVNGQTGYVVDILLEDTTKKLVLEFDGEEFVYENEMLENISLAYATTIHKSQGSEWASIIMVVSTEHSFQLTKPLIYTGITRAKKMLTLVGDKEAFIKGSLKARRKRYTNLNKL